MPNKIKLAIGLPAYTGQITAFSHRMWLSIGATLATSEERFTYVGSTLIETCGIDVARNRLVLTAMDQGADWLLMIDADTWHEDAHDILRMISEADRWGPNGAAVVAAQVPKRDPNDTHLMVYRYAYGKRTPVKLDAGLEQIDAAATAMMAINLGFLQRASLVNQQRGGGFDPPWFKFVWQPGSIVPYQSEDLYFCECVRNAGGVILGDGRFVAKHLQRPAVIGGTDR